MHPIHITVTGRLGADPRTFTVRDDTPGVELRLALDLPPRGDGQEITRWVKVTAFGLLASHTAASFHTGDRVTVLADDLKAESWIDKDRGPEGEPRARGQIALRAVEIAASARYDTLSTGLAARKAARAAAANGHPNDLPAGEQADMRVLAGVTATS